MNFVKMTVYIIHLFHNSSVRVMNSRVSSQCLYTISYMKHLLKKIAMVVVYITQH